MDAENVAFKRFHFFLSDLVKKIVLSVQIARFDHVEIDKNQVSYPYPGKGDRTVGAQTSASGNPNGV
jgi:hypothetical protein